MLQYEPDKYKYAFYKGMKYRVLWYGYNRNNEYRVHLRWGKKDIWTNRYMVNFIPNKRVIDKSVK